MNRKSACEAGKAFVAILGVLAIGLMLNGCGKPKTVGGPPQDNAAEVAVVVVQPEHVTITTELSGRASAFLVAEVRPQVSGIIQKRLFDEGGDIKAGDLLYQIDPAFYKAAYTSAKASLAKAEANLPPVRLKAERYKDLVAVKAVSQQNYDDIAAALKQSEADLEIARAAMETAGINLAYTSITAPISGRIGKSSVTIGALATAHQAVPFTTIQQLDPAYVDVSQSSANLLCLKQKIASGNLKRDGEYRTRVRLILENGTLYPLEGALKFSDVTVDPKTGSVILRMIFPNPDHILLPGMYVRALIEEGVNAQAILVPQRGITRDQKGNATALVADKADKVEQRLLKIDRTIGDKWMVSEGLNAGDRVILEGLQKVKPGSSVKVVLFEEKPVATPPTATLSVTDTEK